VALAHRLGLAIRCQGRRARLGHHRTRLNRHRPMACLGEEGEGTTGGWLGSLHAAEVDAISAKGHSGSVGWRGLSC